MTRRRRAPAARETSDVRRGRGLVAAALLAFVAVIAAIGVGAGPGALVSPGPLALPHRERGLDCRACHEPGERAATCSGCHGEQASTRSGHRRLRASGELSCGDCHALHRAEHGLAFFEKGRALFYGPGFERDVSEFASAFRPARTTFVPLIGAGACERCHDLGDPRDPAAICFTRPSPEGARFALCFDEHRVDPGGTAAAEAARELSIRGSSALRPTGGASLAPVIFGLSVALLVLGLRQSGSKALSGLGRRAPDPAVPSRAPPNVRRLPVIDATRCLGCSACVDACPYDVLEIENYVAVVARPDACCGLVACQQSCPNGSLSIRLGEQLEDCPALGEGFELLDRPGVHLAGDVTGQPLIRIAVEQGAEAARVIGKRLREAPHPGGHRLDADVIVAGAGPAGLSAALELQASGFRVIVLEQGKLAESIQSFPRGKLILDRPISDRARLPLWLGECTKEELVARWSRRVRRARLDLREGVRVTRIECLSGSERDPEFEVWGEDGSGRRSYRARRVVLAVGRRGTPRKLDVEIPSSMQSRVHYGLSDAKGFAGLRVSIVGLGDSALEAARALARQPGTRVTLSYRGGAFRRGTARNVSEVRRLAATGAIDIVFESEVEALGEGRVTLRTPGGPRTFRCDALFVMIGSVPGGALLEALAPSRARAAAKKRAT